MTELYMTHPYFAMLEEMMRRRAAVALLGLAFGFGVFAWTSAVVLAKVSCPVHDNSNPYFTGKSQTIDGHLMYEYKCVNGGGHTFWVRADRT